MVQGPSWDLGFLWRLWGPSQGLASVGFRVSPRIWGPSGGGWVTAGVWGLAGGCISLGICGVWESLWRSGSLRGGPGPCHALPSPIPAGGPLGDVRAAPAGPGTDSMSEASAAAALPGAGGPGEGGPWGRVLGCPSSPGAHPRVFPSPLGLSWSVTPSLRTHSKVSLSLGPHPHSLGAYPGVSPLPCGTSHSPIGPHP